MTIGWDAPRPPVRTGVADYAALLLEPLRALGPVSLEAGDIRFRHLGNNRLHTEIYRRASKEPGVAVLHDAVLLHFHLGYCASEAEFREEFVFNYGRWHADLAGRLWARRAAAESDAEAFRWPMLKRICAASRAIVVHNARAAALVRRHHQGVPLFEVPHPAFFGSAPDQDLLDRWRRRLNLQRSHHYVFSVLGYLRPQKRLLTVLRAFHRVRRVEPGAVLLIAGDCAPASYLSAMQPLLDRPGVLRVPYTAPADFDALLQLSDAVVNLRYPSAGETSGITLRAMAAARPVVLTAGEEIASFPEGVFLPVPCGEAEEDTLFESMHWLIGLPDLGRRMGRAARAHLEAHHAPELVAARYWEIARSV